MPKQQTNGFTLDGWTIAFIALFAWRYLRQVVHLVSFWLYHPILPVADPTITGEDVTIVIPTVDPGNDHFTECMISCLFNNPAKILVVTAGRALQVQSQEALRNVFDQWEAQHPGRLTRDQLNQMVDVLAADEANKRLQVSVAIRETETAIIALVDDHVIWPPTFLEHSLPPFEKPKIGIVATNKLVIREDNGHMSVWDRMLNVVQCLYLERHNFEICSTNAVDGSVFVVSGRTSLVRTVIVKDEEFLHGYLNDYWFFGLVGPIKPDDDNFLTRWIINHGWSIKVQHMPETTIVTSLGSASKFAGGLIRWARTTWRSNSTSLTSLRVWRRYPWAVYAIYLSSFTNFALFYDPILMYSFQRSTFSGMIPHGTGWVVLVVWMIFFKMAKPFAYFWRQLQDLLFVPGYFLFTWGHSLIKLAALLTAYNVQWSGRNLEQINDEANDSQV